MEKTRYRRCCQSDGRRMGRYKDYDREPKRGGYDDDQKSGEQTSGGRSNYPSPSADTRTGIGRSDRQMVQCREGLRVCRRGRRVRGTGFRSPNEVWQQSSAGTPSADAVFESARQKERMNHTERAIRDAAEKGGYGYRWWKANDL